MLLAKDKDLAQTWPSALRPSGPFLRYLVVGAASAAVDFSVFKLLDWLRVDPLLANPVSRPLGGLTCFLLNRSFTFRAAGRSPAAIQFTRFWCVFGASFLLTEGLLALLCKVLGMPGFPAKMLAEAIALLFNFLALKHWTFR